MGTTEWCTQIARIAASLRCAGISFRVFIPDENIGEFARFVGGSPCRGRMTDRRGNVWALWRGHWEIVGHE